MKKQALSWIGVAKMLKTDMKKVSTEGCICIFFAIISQINILKFSYEGD
jgi:hypothetical protein